MDWQLRIYTIADGALDAWLEEWRAHVAPLRRSVGFEILGPWVEAGTTTFVWLIGYGGADGFDAANARYYESPERRALDPDPARHIVASETRMLREAEAP